MPKFENAARKLEEPRGRKESVAAHEVPAKKKGRATAEKTVIVKPEEMAAEEMAVKERLKAARGRIGVPVEEAPEEVEVDLTELERGEIAPPKKLVEEEVKGLGRARLERLEKETRGMTVDRAKVLVPRAAVIWERVRRITNAGAPHAHLALLKEAEKYAQKTALPTAYVFALAKYTDAYNEYMETESEEAKEEAEKEFQNVSSLTESLGLGKVEVREKKFEAPKRGPAPEAGTWSEPSKAVPEYEVDLTGLEESDVDLSELEEEEAPPKSGEREMKKSKAFKVPPPYTAKFSELPRDVKEQVAKDTNEFFEDVTEKEEHAREVLGRTYNLIGRVNELISNNPAARSLLDKERAKYGYGPSNAEAFMLAMSRFIDARDNDDIEAAKKEEANVRKIADAVGLTGNAQFESTMARPVTLRGMRSVQERQAGVSNRQRRANPPGGIAA